MLSNKQKMKKCNKSFAKFQVLISKKYKEYKKNKLKNQKKDIIKLKKQNEKVFWKKLGFIGLFFLSCIVCNYLFFSFIVDFKETPFGDVGDMIGLINAAIDHNDIGFLYIILLFYPFGLTLLVILIANNNDGFFNFKENNGLIFNEEEEEEEEEEFKLNYVLSKEELEREYKRIEQIINKEELQEIMFKVNKRLNDDTIDIGSSIFIENIYEELSLKIEEEEENNKMKMVINKKLNYILR